MKTPIDQVRYRPKRMLGFEGNPRKSLFLQLSLGFVRNPQNGLDMESA